VSWIRESVLASGNISAGDEELITVVDDPAEAIRVIQQAHAQHNNGADAGRARAAESEPGD